ncbi:MAG: class I SAM-dependent methyltransferase [Rhodospirillales bacterium]|nr:class I SAM-dependent methyltransferase [Rhodospirillales bacterium]
MTDGDLFPASAMPDDDWWQALWPDPTGTLAKIGIAPGMTIIDLCCGNGLFTASLACLVGAGGRVIAVDMDANMLATARARTQQAVDVAPSATCQWIEADACTIDQILSATDKADALIIANTFHGVPDKTVLSAVVARVLKPSGCFIIINWHARPRAETVILGQARGPKEEMRMTPQEVERAVVPAGFTLRQVIELPPYHYAAVFKVAQAGTRA